MRKNISLEFSQVQIYRLHNKTENIALEERKLSNIMKIFKRSFICPFCFEKQETKNLEYRCVNQRCKEETDDIPLTLYMQGDASAPLKRRPFFKGNLMMGHMETGLPRCPECRTESGTYICPKCHNKIPESTLMGQDMIISVVGARNAGKSHFVGVIIQELLKRIAPAFDSGSIVPFDDTGKRYKEVFFDPLYNNNKTLELTATSMENTENGAYKPYIYTYQYHPNGGKKVKSFTLVFFDTAGEDLNEEDTMSTVNKYICKSAGIIFLLDPMQIDCVREQLSEEVTDNSSSTRDAGDIGEIMARVSSLIRKDKHLRTQDQIDIPVAVAFSKFDAIVPLIPAGSTVLETSPHVENQYFTVEDGHNVDQEIRGFLAEWESDAFITQIENNYKNFAFFCLSALGLDNMPESGAIKRPRPHRIEDPLLWLLEENSVIPHD